MYDTMKLFYKNAFSHHLLTAPRNIQVACTVLLIDFSITPKNIFTLTYDILVFIKIKTKNTKIPHRNTSFMSCVS